MWTDAVNYALANYRIFLIAYGVIGLCLAGIIGFLSGYHIGSQSAQTKYRLWVTQLCDYIDMYKLNEASTSDLVALLEEAHQQKDK